MTFDHIGTFIRNYRQTNGESLQALADRSGVSRSMIAQIESNQKSPTVTTLAKLAEAMSISLGDLVEPSKHTTHYVIVKASKTNIVSKQNSPFVCHQLLAQSNSCNVDFYHFYFSKYGKTGFAANKLGTQKTVWLDTGQITLHLHNETISLNAGQAIHFAASTPHRFENRSGPLAKGCFTVSYSN
ncbi:helix-turn-helix domain-containing protein [Saccharophagus degradans]|uniref:Helix-turn-helix domain-containing protein n=1 Tax=Saccharophagus degradans TaxID=86304 RepID=A0AAW7XAB1_9GAMM|nr:helix-turn-helix transcriptional regulator [Saccharophagus degradans]MBU2984557.1 helix-turn-helix domain-containing protein [Saccharophagus degradans]MDO6423463.1 helix-turn-helix domain-containing protein [Saccharophagus degradans]MDO6606868.1 helix-turn-helix domain-containing protein [Saccharophagus degradans]